MVRHGSLFEWRPIQIPLPELINTNWRAKHQRCWLPRNLVPRQRRCHGNSKASGLRFWKGKMVVLSNWEPHENIVMFVSDAERNKGFPNWDVLNAQGRCSPKRSHFFDGNREHNFFVPNLPHSPVGGTAFCPQIGHQLKGCVLHRGLFVPPPPAVGRGTDAAFRSDAGEYGTVVTCPLHGTQPKMRLDSLVPRFSETTVNSHP